MNVLPPQEIGATPTKYYPRDQLQRSSRAVIQTKNYLKQTNIQTPVAAQLRLPSSYTGGTPGSAKSHLFPAQLHQPRRTCVHHPHNSPPPYIIHHPSTGTLQQLIVNGGGGLFEELRHGPKKVDSSAQMERGSAGFALIAFSER